MRNNILKKIKIIFLSIIVLCNTLNVPVYAADDIYISGNCVIDGVCVNQDYKPIPGAIRRGIDVSCYQGQIDWEKVANDDVDFAFIRAGSYKAGLDDFFEYNVTEALKYGLDVGLYVYSYATTPRMAEIEAQFLIQQADRFGTNYPLVYDIEDAWHKLLSHEELDVLVETFCKTVEDAGYIPLVYSSKNWLENKLSNTKYDQWVAQYSSECTLKEPYTFWQASSHTKIDGIKGRVDVDFQFALYGTEFDKSINDKDDDYEKNIIEETVEEEPEAIIKEIKSNIYSDSDSENKKSNVYSYGYTGFKVTDYGITYYKNNILQKGLVKIDDDYYYFSLSTGIMVIDETIKIGNNSYYIDNNGIVNIKN